MTNDSFDSRPVSVAATGGKPGRDAARVAITASPSSPGVRASGWRAILALPLLRRSVILSEIIGPPRGLKDWGE